MNHAAIWVRKKERPGGYWQKFTAGSSRDLLLLSLEAVKKFNLSHHLNNSGGRGEATRKTGCLHPNHQFGLPRPYFLRRYVKIYKYWTTGMWMGQKRTTVVNRSEVFVSNSLSSQHTPHPCGWIPGNSQWLSTFPRCWVIPAEDPNQILFHPLSVPFW